MKEFRNPYTQMPLEEESIKRLSLLIIINKSSTSDDNPIRFVDREKSLEKSENILDRSSANMIREITDVFDIRIFWEEGSFSIVRKDGEGGIFITVTQIFILL